MGADPARTEVEFFRRRSAYRAWYKALSAPAAVPALSEPAQPQLDAAAAGPAGAPTASARASASLELELEVAVAAARAALAVS